MIKKITLCTTIGFLLVGCGGEKDVSYYLNNIPQAKEKLQYCKVKYSKIDNDQQALSKLVKECDPAEIAIVQFNRTQAKNELLEKYKGNDWKQIITAYANNKCSKLNKNKSYSTPYYANLPESEDESQCYAWRNLYEQQVKIGKAELDKFSLSELDKKIADFCSIDKRAISSCAVFSNVYHAKEKEIQDQKDKIAQDRIDEIEQNIDKFTFEDVNKEFNGLCSNNREISTSICLNFNKIKDVKEEEYVEHLVSNPQELIKVWNQCVDDNKKSRSNLTYTYPCKQATKARDILEISRDYNFSRKM